MSIFIEERIYPKETILDSVVLIRYRFIRHFNDISGTLADGRVASHIKNGGNRTKMFFVCLGFRVNVFYVWLPSSFFLLFTIGVTTVVDFAQLRIVLENLLLFRVCPYTLDNGRLYIPLWERSSLFYRRLLINQTVVHHTHGKA